MKDDNFPEYDDCAEFIDFINGNPTQPKRQKNKVIVIAIFIFIILTIFLFAVVFKNKAPEQQSKTFSYNRLVCSCNYVVEENHHVGNEWRKETKIDGVIGNVDTPNVYTVFDGDTLIIHTRIIESDSRNDVGEETTKIQLTEDKIQNGFCVVQIIKVIENSGRYKGNYAVIKVYYTFDPYKPN